MATVEPQIYCVRNGAPIKLGSEGALERFGSSNAQRALCNAGNGCGAQTIAEFRANILHDALRRISFGDERARHGRKTLQLVQRHTWHRLCTIEGVGGTTLFTFRQ